MLYNNRNTPRGLILFIDICIVIFSIFLSYLLRFNFKIPQEEINLLPVSIGVVVGIRIISFIISRSFSGIIRYTEAEDVVRIILVTAIGSILIVVTDLVSHYFYGLYFLPRAIIIIEFITTSMSLIAFRLIVKVAYWEFKNEKKEGQNILIFGAGEAGILTKKAIEKDNKRNNKIIGFIDDDPTKIGKKIENITIYSIDKIAEISAINNIEQLVISIQNIAPSRKQEIVELCLQFKIKVSHVPPVTNWINGELSIKQLKDIEITELLERDEIKLDYTKIIKDFSDKTILISGAAGSIGSEICRQLIKYHPKKLIFLDQAETPLYYLDLEFEKHSNEIEVVIGDIRNEVRMKNIFNTYKPEIVFHAAAYKHVPLMEHNPSEAISSNVGGTKLLADLSLEYEVEKFVMISTDKAVNPTNVMGASKRIAEMYVQSLNNTGKTRFITTRFGNVLGSNGSVIPLFKKQIQDGGPITITHPEITRYFMTIPEACQLVLEAASHGEGGEIFVFDMGKSVKILDLAKKMINLSGLELGKDIQIVYSGLRPGEKLYEELLADAENNLPTHHEKIMKAKAQITDLQYITKKISDLVTITKSQNNFAIVKIMKEIVPEFISNNSSFEKLD